MIICGGTYKEECLSPSWDRIFGSGLRAAVALSKLSSSVTLHTHVASALIDDVVATSKSCGIELHATETTDNIVFRYAHALAQPQWTKPTSSVAPLNVSGENILRFSCLEGDTIVKGSAVVFDPQGATESGGFSANGSSAERLSIVLNEHEIETRVPGCGLKDAAALLMSEDGAIGVVVKLGVRGALVIEPEKEPTLVPAYYSERVFKIGSGDIFSSVFAYNWAEKGLPIADAADIASRSTAHYVATQDPIIPKKSDLILGPPVKPIEGSIYLAAPFFDAGQRWLVEEAYLGLRRLGGRVFSPLHHVGIGLSDVLVAGNDLVGLKESTVVLAILNGQDPGTIFEIGYARALGIPVVVLAQNTRRGDLTMLIGTGCKIVEDLTTAAYHAMWGEK